MKSTRSTARHPHGFTTTQMVITLAIISIVSTFGVMGIKSAREEFKHQSAARLFASYVEKARADAIRRHAEDGEESSIETFGPATTRYDVTMDWGSGLETRTFNLDDGLTFDVVARKVSFDWRGRISEAWVFQIKNSYSGINLPVDVSGSGDITVGEQHFPDQSIPPVDDIAEVTGDVDTDPSPSPTVEPTATPTPTPTPTPDPDATPTPTPEPTPTPHGNGGSNPNSGGSNGNGNGNSSPTPTPTPTPTPSDPPVQPCASTISPSTLSLSQSDPTKQSGTATFTMINATGVRILTPAQAGNGNSLDLDLSLKRIDGSGSSVLTVTTKNGSGNRGVFLVSVTATPSCGTGAQLTVSVSN